TPSREITRPTPVASTVVGSWHFGTNTLFDDGSANPASAHGTRTTTSAPSRYHSARLSEPGSCGSQRPYRSTPTSTNSAGSRSPVDGTTRSRLVLRRYRSHPSRWLGAGPS